MVISLPPIGQKPVELSHFPTHFQAFLFRAWEYLPVVKIAQILDTTEENVINSAKQMGLPDYAPGNIWLERGYLTVIRRMWHILPYEQLLQSLDMSMEELALIIKEEDFLYVKLKEKPDCEPVKWRELTEAEKEQTAKIKAVMETVDISGKAPFQFEYHVPQINFSGAEQFASRIIYPFSGLYQHAFDVESTYYLPDEQLEAYQKLGINGIWTQALLSQLSEFPFAPELSAGYEQRLERMRQLVNRLGKYGIKLYLYINEPRFMPVSFFDQYPELRGHEQEGNACLCTSTETVQKYLKDSVASICRAVPELGGFFTISRSENLTNCHSRVEEDDIPCNCPRCKNRSAAEVTAEVVTCIFEGVRSVSKDIKVFAWSWGWDSAAEEIIHRLPKEIIILTQSELAVPFEIGGIKGKVRDYSMSILGPGDHAKGEWQLARQLGHEVGAKVQVNTTWEASTVPAVPVTPSVDEHMQRLSREGVGHLLLSWTLGGYPSRNLAAAAKYFYEKCDYSSCDPQIHDAQLQFAEAFREFPFHIRSLYFGPHNAGPSSMLFAKPTGYEATMTGFVYDDLNKWRSIYPVDVYEDQFDKLCSKWEKGLKLLHESEDSEEYVMAWGAYCLFRSSLNQIRFIRARDDGRWQDAISAVVNEQKIARIMLQQMNKNAAIGYEAANHYYYSKGQLVEKILNCQYLVEYFSNL